jgi:hypothetical protein
MKYRMPIAVFFTVLMGCGRADMKINFPETVPNETVRYMQEHEYTAVIYLDSANCSPCLLNVWKPYKRILERKDTGILLVFNDFEEQTIVDILKSVNVAFHYIIDKEGEFRTGNEVFRFVRNNVFVMDRDKTVIMVESPIENEQTWDMFLRRIKKTEENE